MPHSFESELHQELEDLRRQGLLRRVRELQSPQGVWVEIDGARLRNFSSNDYLGLANHPDLRQAGSDAIRRAGVGAGASRLVCGSHELFQSLEMALADFKGTKAALVFPNGYATSLGVIPALVGPGDVVLADRLAHASIIDGARLSGAVLRRFRHNDIDHLETLLLWAKTQTRTSETELQTFVSKTSSTPPDPLHRRARRVLIATESVFSMDGDQAPVAEIVRLKEKHGAVLYLDEAHALGVLGPQGRGLAAALGCVAQVEVLMGTLGKAVGSSGGFVCGSAALREILVNKARSLIFSTAPSPATAGAALSGLHLLKSERGDQLREQLWDRIHSLASLLNLPTAPQSAILPLILGGEELAVEVSHKLRNAGFLVPAIRYPTVPRRQARLRITVCSQQSQTDLEELAAAIKTVCPPECFSWGTQKHTAPG